MQQLSLWRLNNVVYFLKSQQPGSLKSDVFVVGIQQKYNKLQTDQQLASPRVLKKILST